MLDMPPARVRVRRAFAAPGRAVSNSRRVLASGRTRSGGIVEGGGDQLGSLDFWTGARRMLTRGENDSKSGALTGPVSSYVSTCISRTFFDTGVNFRPAGVQGYTEVPPPVSRSWNQLVEITQGLTKMISSPRSATRNGTEAKRAESARERPTPIPENGSRPLIWPPSGP